MRHIWSAAVISALLALVTGCSVSDVVDGPFIDDWQLVERRCADPPRESQCYKVTLGVSNHTGENAASCRIYPQQLDGSEYFLDGSTAPTDPDHGVVFIDEFLIQAGDTPVFDVVLPAINADGFWRWQVDCDPGAPG